MKSFPELKVFESKVTVQELATAIGCPVADLAGAHVVSALEDLAARGRQDRRAITRDSIVDWIVGRLPEVYPSKNLAPLVPVKNDVFLASLFPALRSLQGVSLGEFEQKTKLERKVLGAGHNGKRLYGWTLPTWRAAVRSVKRAFPELKAVRSLDELAPSKLWRELKFPT
jgi:hypothetical protein